MCPLATFMFMTNSTLLWWTLDSVLLLVVIKLKALKQWFLTEGRALQGGVKKFPRGREPLHALQHGKALKGNVSLPSATPVMILRRYILLGLLPADIDVGVKFLEILQAGFELAYKHLGAQRRRVFSRHAKSV